MSSDALGGSPSREGARPDGRVDVLLVCMGSTMGWRAGGEELAAGLRRAGATVALELIAAGAPVRTLMLTDLLQALTARRLARAAIARHRPRAIIYGSVTSALLWPRPGAVWLDSTAAENRPGRHGLWQVHVELRRLRAAPMVLTWSPRGLDALSGPRPETIVVPVPIEPSGPAGERDIAAIAYAANPEKRRLDFVLDAWRQARREGETLLVAGVSREAARTGADLAGVRFAGVLAREEYRALVRRSRVFVAAPRIEDFGLAPLEALADGCQLVTTPARGPYPARDIARQLDSRLVAEDLVPALRAALDTPTAGYAERAAELLAPYRREAIDATLADRVLPALLPGWGQR